MSYPKAFVIFRPTHKNGEFVFEYKAVAAWSEEDIEKDYPDFTIVCSMDVSEIGEVYSWENKI
jgi:hypothetical protein